MIAPGVLAQLVRADFLERVRRHSFLVTLGFTLYAAYMFLPPNHSRYATLNLAGHRGVYNSAWVGSVIAMLSMTFLTLAGFYLVKNAVDRDRQSGVGQILAATPLSGPAYLLGKMLSNFAVLSAMVGVLAVAAGGMQLLRGEDTHLRIVPLVSPFVLLTLPTMALVAALAVFFEVTPGLRGGAGNIVYFFVWIFGLSLPAAVATGRMSGPLGTEACVPQMQAACAAAFPEYPGVGGGFAMGFNIRNQGVWDLKTFVWQGVHWTPALLAWRAVWLASSVALTMIAALLFDRFDTTGRGVAVARKAPGGGAGVERGVGRERSDGAPRRARPPRLPLASQPCEGGTKPAPSRLDIALRTGGSRFGALVVAELRIMLKGVTRWWYFVALALVVLGLFVPLVGVRQFVAPFALIWPMLLWSVMGTREMRHGTDALLFSSPRPVTRLLTAQWLAGVVVALAVAGGVAVRFALAGQLGSLAAILVAAAFAPSLALAFGTWTGSAKLFEVIYLLLWYGGPMNRIPPIDFVGTTQPSAGVGPIATFLMATVALMGLALVGRRRQVRR